MKISVSERRRLLEQQRARMHAFGRYSAAIRQARNEWNKQADKEGRFRDGAKLTGPALKAYWRKIRRRASEITGLPMPRGFKLGIGGLKCGGLKTGKLKTGNLR